MLHGWFLRENGAVLEFLDTSKANIYTLLKLNVFRKNQNFPLVVRCSVFSSIILLVSAITAIDVAVWRYVRQCFECTMEFLTTCGVSFSGFMV